MTTNTFPQQPELSATERALQKAIAHHQTGQLQEAEEYYQSVLQTEPNHPEANYGMGMLAVLMQQPAAGLPYFVTALDAAPAHRHYWLSYIDALYQAGQIEEARQILALARQQGLDGYEAEALTTRLGDGSSGAERSETALQPAVEPPLQAADERQRDARQKSDKSPDTPHQEPSPQEINTLVTLVNQGRFVEALASARTMTERIPQYPLGWKVLGVVYQQMGQNREALLPMQRTVALSPGDAEARNNLGIILQNLGRLDEAEASYRQALRLNPDYAHAHGNLGATLQALGHLEMAEASYRRALRIKPDYMKALSNLGAVLSDLHRLDEAEAVYRRMLEVNSESADANLAMGLICHRRGRLIDAVDRYRRALQVKPGFVELHLNLGDALRDSGKLVEAEASYRRAIDINPESYDAHNKLGNVVQSMGRSAEAEAAYRRAIGINPNLAGTYYNLGNTLKELGRPIEAEPSYLRALEISPDYFEAYNNLGTALQDMGRSNEAEARYRQALEINPACDQAFSNYLFSLTQNETVDAKSLFKEHCRFGATFERALPPDLSRHTNTRIPDRCLQIGFVSGDFNDHAVASFVEPVLVHLSGDPQLSLHAYYNSITTDKVTQRLRGSFAHWHPIAGLSDGALDEKIRADGIDILIDLSGHSAKNRLLTFARKPAPLQVSWIGYPGTTGMNAMDYFLADSCFLPPGKFDDQFTEKIVRLPATAPFSPYQNAPSVNGLPALSNDYVTFGSFNRLSKLSPSVVALWSQLMRALPDSRILLGGIPQDGKCDALIEWFAREGIVRERLDIHPRGGMEGYLSLHQQVDICLDTFPYNGGTTTSHALWMGVPTLTLVGDTVPGRVGAMLLSHVGLDNFIALDKDDFVRKSTAWAGNLAELSMIRAGLRERVANSAMGQPALIAAGLEHAMRIMWQRWCAGLPAESFEVTREEIAAAMLEVAR